MLWQADLPGQGWGLMTAGDVVCAWKFNNYQAVAFNARNGRRLWTVNYPGYANNVGSGGSPAMTPGAVYMMPPAPAGQYEICALAPATGQTIWKTTITGFIGQVLGATPGLVYLVDEVAGGDGPAYSLRALHASSGTEAWRTPVLGNQGDLAVNGSRIFLANSSGVTSALYAMEARTGTQLWSSPPATSNSDALQVTTNGSVICALGATPDTGLSVLRASDGTLLWKSDLPGGFVWAVIARNAVYALTGSSELVALHAIDGRRIWGHPANEQVEPMVSGDLIYAGKTGGGLLALHASNGKLEWQSSINIPKFDQPVTGSTAIYLNDDKRIYALRM